MYTAQLVGDDLRPHTKGKRMCEKPLSLMDISKSSQDSRPKEQRALILPFHATCVFDSKF